MERERGREREREGGRERERVREVDAHKSFGIFQEHITT